MNFSRLAAVLPFLSVFALAWGASKNVDPEEFIGDDSGGSDFEVGLNGDAIGGEGGPTLAGIELTPGNAVVTIDTATSPATTRSSRSSSARRCASRCSRR